MDLGSSFISTPNDLGALGQLAEFQTVEEMEQRPHPEGLNTGQACCCDSPDGAPNVDNTPAESLLESPCHKRGNRGLLTVQDHKTEWWSQNRKPEAFPISHHSAFQDG